MARAIHRTIYCHTLESNDKHRRTGKHSERPWRFSLSSYRFQQVEQFGTTPRIISEDSSRHSFCSQPVANWPPKPAKNEPQPPSPHPFKTSGFVTRTGLPSMNPSAFSII
jgi:hypothetical protein